MLQEKLGLKKKLPIFCPAGLAEVDLSMSVAHKASLARRVGKANRKYVPKVSKLVNQDKTNVKRAEGKEATLGGTFDQIAAPHDVEAAITAKAALDNKLARLK